MCEHLHFTPAHTIILIFEQLEISLTLQPAVIPRVGAFSLKIVDQQALSCPPITESLTAAIVAVMLPCETVLLLPLPLLHAIARWETLHLYCRDSQSCLPIKECPLLGSLHQTPPCPSCSFSLFHQQVLLKINQISY